MAKFETFEDIVAWQKTRALNIEIYTASNNGSFSKDYALKDQMRRAAISIVSNIAEGFERRTKQEFIHFLSIAKASCGELRAQLYIALDLKYISEEEFKKLHSIALEISKMIGGLMGYLKEYNSSDNIKSVNEPEVQYISNLEN